MAANSEQTLWEKAKSYLPFIYVVILLFALRWTLIEPYVVPTGSMEPTLKCGDRLYALKCAYDVRFPFTEYILFRTGEVKRGDVILFRNPQNPSITYVKRAVGLPGDRLKFTRGALYINDQEVIKTPFTDRSILYDIEEADTKTLYLEQLGNVKHYAVLNRRVEQSPELEAFHHRTTDDIVVPSGHLFAVGDNRDNSSDSRAWGFVPMENLKGRAMFIWYSSWPGWFAVRPERVGTLIQ